MIDTIHGTIINRSEQKITLNVHGIGFLINVPSATIFEAQQNTTLHIHMHWNQEQGPSLYGFCTELERTIFCMVLDCSGVGPKIALAVLADLGPERFIAAIHAENEKELSSVSGIGSKKAEHIIVHLRHKVAKLIKSGINLDTTETDLGQWHEIAQVLESLNYSKPEITDTMKYLRESHAGASNTFDQLMRQALSFLAKKA